MIKIKLIDETVGRLSIDMKSKSTPYTFSMLKHNVPYNKGESAERLKIAHLFATAPELLEALKSILAEHSGGKGRKRQIITLDEIATLITRAEGGKV